MSAWVAGKLTSDPILRLPPSFVSSHRREASSHHPHLCSAQVQHRRRQRVHLHPDSRSSERLHLVAEDDHHSVVRRQQAWIRGRRPEGWSRWWINLERCAESEYTGLFCFRFLLGRVETDESVEGTKRETTRPVSLTFPSLPPSPALSSSSKRSRSDPDSSTRTPTENSSAPPSSPRSSPSTPSTTISRSPSLED